MLTGVIVGFLAFIVIRFGATLFYTLDQNERAVKTIFGRAERLSEQANPALLSQLSPEEATRYHYPRVKVIPPGGPYIKMPWERVYKVSVATQNLNMAMDPDDPSANKGGKMLEAVTKDQLNTGIVGQIRYRVAEQNLYAYLFAIKYPISHVMGYLVSILRERIANFEADKGSLAAETDFGVSINDLRKNLRSLNEHMVAECKSSEARYGVILDASLITGIEPPNDVESALAAINTAHNQVSSDISLAQAKADQTVVQSRRAVEIETLKAQAEAEPLRQMAQQLLELKKNGIDSLKLYRRNIRLGLFKQAEKVYHEVKS